MDDKNLLSFNGPELNGQAAYVETADASTPGYASALKCSTGLTDFVLHVKYAKGGKDAVSDVNNLCRNVSVTVDEATPTGQFVATRKGGSRGIHDYFPCILAHGKVCDFIYDDWSDQSHAATKECSLNARMADGSPVYVIALKTKPSLVPGSGPYRFPWWQPLNLRIPFTENYYVVGFIFDTLRRWGFFRSEANT